MLTKSQKAELLEELEAELQDLLAKRQQLLWIDNRISTLRGLIAGAKAYWDTASIANQKVALGLVEPAPPSPATTIAGVVRDILSVRGKPLHVSELLEELKKNGFALSNKNPSSSVALAMKRRPDWFVKVAPNTFGLRKSTEGTAP